MDKHGARGSEIDDAGPRVVVFELLQDIMAESVTSAVLVGCTGLVVSTLPHEKTLIELSSPQV